MVTELVRRLPPPALRPYVVRCEGFAEQTPTPLRRREIASPVVPVIISFATDWRIYDPDRVGSRDERHGSFVAGLHDRPTIVEHPGQAHCMQLDLTPLGAHAAFGVAMDQLANRRVALGDLIGEHRAAALVERLAEAPGWLARFALLERFVVERLDASRDPAPDAVRAWRRLEEVGGNLRIEALARELGCSRRHLAARFREQVGLPPKTVARLLRFQRAVELLRSGGSRRWAQIAHQCGYSDQSHFNRDFRDLAGTSPGEFIASLLPADVGVAADGPFPFVQDEAPAVA